MIFTRAQSRYGRTPEPITPYQKAAQLWDERIGSARQQARNWRLLALGLLALSLLLSAGLIWQARGSQVVPYVVEVAPSGEIHRISPALEDFTPSDAQIAYHLARFIRNLRSLSIDPVVVRRAWLEAYDHASDQALQLLNQFAAEQAPFDGIGERSISVEIQSVLRISPDSFQVKWLEETWRHGAKLRSETWTAILSLRLQPPKDAVSLRKNPLGIQVQALHWSRDLKPGELP